MAKSKKKEKEQPAEKKTVHVQYDPMIVRKNLHGGMGGLEPVDYDEVEENGEDVLAAMQADPYGQLKHLELSKGPKKGNNQQLLPSRYNVTAKAPKGTPQEPSEYEVQVVRQDN